MIAEESKYAFLLGQLWGGINAMTKSTDSPNQKIANIVELEESMRTEILKLFYPTIIDDGK